MVQLRRRQVYPPGLSQSARSFCEDFAADIEWLREILGKPDIGPAYVLTEEEALHAQQALGQQRGIFSQPANPEEGNEMAKGKKRKLANAVEQLASEGVANATLELARELTGLADNKMVEVDDLRRLLKEYTPPDPEEELVAEEGETVSSSALVRQEPHPRSRHANSAPKRTATPDDWAIVDRWDDRIHTLDGYIGVAPDPRHLKREDGRSASFPDALYPDDESRRVWMDWDDALSRKQQGKLPLVSEVTIKELRRDLEQMTLVNTTCALCSRRLNASLNGMAFHILSREANMPLTAVERDRERGGRVKRRPATFPSVHRPCKRLYDILGDAAIALQDEPKSPETFKKYRAEVRARLMADEGALLADLLNMPDVEGVHELGELIDAIFKTYEQKMGRMS